MESIPPEMQQMLAQLQHLQETNPAAFAEAIKAVGMGGANEQENNSFLHGNDNGSLQQMASAIESMRKENATQGVDQELNIGKDKNAHVKGVEITPTPGFTFKTTRVADSMKVFVNVAQHELVEEPEMKKKLNDDGEEVEGMNIPMSVGPPRIDKDKKEAACIVYDVIVHPVVVSESANDKSGRYREFICQLGIQYLEQKYKEPLNKQYKLPKLKYMGETIAKQYIQDRKNMPKIEEVSSKAANSSGASVSSKGDKKKVSKKKLEVEVIDKEMAVHASWVSSGGEDSLDATQWRLFDLNDCDHIEYTGSLTEYTDPIQSVPDGVSAFMVCTDVQSYDILLPNLAINVSPFKLIITLPGYKRVVCYLPCAMLPALSYHTSTRPYEGCLSAVRLQIVLRVDKRGVEAMPDAGSRPWLMSQALSGGGDYNNREGGGDNLSNPYAGEYSDYINFMHNQQHSRASSTKDISGEEVFAEDKFHLQLPDDVDQYTGVKLDPAVANADDPFLGKSAQKQRGTMPAVQRTGETEDAEEFPEDRFHRKDASSQFMINQREQARKDKWEKHEKEKKERESDPNVEYVDMDDFRPGGKYGPKEDEAKARQRQIIEAQSEEMRKAAEVVASSQKLPIDGLSSTLWTELLD